mmetsp:Transcript_50075/g.119124  ORF Transcript_50075/g.119124 Transcript_50075/m.119124 type:complete len:215 (-) Transcript_50075:1273-1917(-)
MGRPQAQNAAQLLCSELVRTRSTTFPHCLVEIEVLPQHSLLTQQLLLCIGRYSLHQLQASLLVDVPHMRLLRQAHQHPIEAGDKLHVLAGGLGIGDDKVEEWSLLHFQRPLPPQRKAKLRKDNLHQAIATNFARSRRPCPCLGATLAAGGGGVSTPLDLRAIEATHPHFLFALWQDDLLPVVEENATQLCGSLRPSANHLFSLQLQLPRGAHTP